MTTAIEYALMAGAAYISNRALTNRIPAPENWNRISYQEPMTSGFEAATFTNGSEIVISFAGTDFSKGIPGAFFTPDFWVGNIPLITGASINGADQLVDAVEYFLTIKNAPANAGKSISLTGHSLGGALASLVGVFFGKTAFTIDQVPAAASSNWDAATLVRDALIARGHTAFELASLNDYIQQQQTNGGIPNQGLVTNLYVNGEIASILPAPHIGSAAGISNDSPGVGASDLHSIALLNVFLQSNKTAAPFKSLNDVTFELRDLMKMIFDPALFYNDPLKMVDAKENFLERLVKHEAGVQGGIQADTMVTRFTQDLWKLAQLGGLTLSENPAYYNWNNVSKMLTAFAMEKYYNETSGSKGAGKTLFEDVSGGIQFDTEAVAASIASAKGYQQYFQNYLNLDLLFTAEERKAIKDNIANTKDWYVQAGASGMTATDSGNRGALMLGGQCGDIGALDGKPINTGIYKALMRRSPIGAGCGIGGIKQLHWRIDAATFNNSEAANDTNPATQSEWRIAA